MTVRAKFKVTSIKREENRIYPHKDEKGNPDYKRPERSDLYSIQMSPVYGNNDPEHENTKFWQATPTGAISLGTINEAAATAFEVGAEYYVDFTPAE